MAMTNGARTGPSRESASVEWLRVVAVQDDVAWRLSLDGGRRTAHSTQRTAHSRKRTLERGWSWRAGQRAVGELSAIAELSELSQT
jgi:hypothetical protein